MAIGIERPLEAIRHIPTSLESCIRHGFRRHATANTRSADKEQLSILMSQYDEETGCLSIIIDEEETEIFCFKCQIIFAYYDYVLTLIKDHIFYLSEDFDTSRFYYNTSSYIAKKAARRFLTPLEECG